MDGTQFVSTLTVLLLMILKTHLIYELLSPAPCGADDISPISVPALPPPHLNKRHRVFFVGFRETMKQICHQGLDQASLYQRDSVSAHVSHAICTDTSPNSALTFRETQSSRCRMRFASTMRYASSVSGFEMTCRFHVGVHETRKS
jgi:hypothetical protein